MNKIINAKKIIIFILCIIMLFINTIISVKVQACDNIKSIVKVENNSVVVDIENDGNNGIIIASLISGGVTVSVTSKKLSGSIRLSFPEGMKGEEVKIFHWENFNKLKPVCNVSVQNLSTNNLYGKYLYVDGDSICYGNGYRGGFGKIIADKYNMNFGNNGVGGATISNMGTTNTVKWGSEMDWDNTQYYLKLVAYDPFADKSAEGFTVPLTKEQYENGFGKYPTAYKMIDGVLTELEYTEEMPTGRFYVKFDVPTYDDNTVTKYYRMWNKNNWLWEAYYSGFKGVHESGSATIATARHWLSSSVNDVDTSADYIIFEGGINDYLMNRPLGKITADKTSIVDTTTIIGGLEYVCRTLLEKCPNAKIVYVVVPKAREYTTKPNGDAAGNKTWKDYHDEIVKVLEKYGIDYVDLFETEFDTANEEYLQYTVNNDGVHPTKEGYEKFYVPYIEEAMTE